MTKAGSTDPKKVRDAIDSLENVKGATGTITYKGQNRIPLKTVYLVTVKDGQVPARSRRCSRIRPTSPPITPGFDQWHLLSVEHLTVAYDAIRAVRDFSFSVECRRDRRHSRRERRGEVDARCTP